MKKNTLPEKKNVKRQINKINLRDLETPGDVYGGTEMSQPIPSEKGPIAPVW